MRVCSNLLLFFFILLMAACNKSITPDKALENHISMLVIEKIEVLDLSENYGLLSSKNDEILLRIDLLAKKEPHLIRQTELLFDSLHLSYPLMDTIYIKSNAKEVLSLSLLELDNKDSSTFVNGLLDSLLRSENFYTTNAIKIDSLFGYDDYLGTKNINLQMPFSKKKNTISFRGKHFLDKYHYHIYFSVQ